jgi:hypothetical protein
MRMRISAVTEEDFSTEALWCAFVVRNKLGTGGVASLLEPCPLTRLGWAVASKDDELFIQQWKCSRFAVC